MKSELDGLKSCPLHKRTPYGYAGVSKTQLSIARHFGGIKVNGDEYKYFPLTDELVRLDVLKWKLNQSSQAKSVDKMKELFKN